MSYYSDKGNDYHVMEYGQAHSRASEKIPYQPTNSPFETGQTYDPNKNRRNPFGLSPWAFGALVALLTALIVGGAVGGGLAGTCKSFSSSPGNSTCGPSQSEPALTGGDAPNATEADAFIRDGGRYVIMNAGTKTAIDLSNGNTDDGTVCQGWSNDLTNTTPHQVWTLQKDKDETWKVLNANGVSYMDMTSGGSDNGNQIQGYHQVDDDSQRWQFYSYTYRGEPHSFAIKNIASGTYVDLDNGSSDDGTKIQGWEGGDSPPGSHQRWILVYVD